MTKFTLEEVRLLSTLIDAGIKAGGIKVHDLPGGFGALHSGLGKLLDPANQVEVKKETPTDG